MNRRYAAAALLALSRLWGADASAANQSACAEIELDAETVLEDGFLAGERQAMAHLREREPDLHRWLVDIDDVDRRWRYGKYFMWFQQPGDCRKAEKEEMIRQLKLERRLRDIRQGAAHSQDKSRYPEDKLAVHNILVEMETGRPPAADAGRPCSGPELSAGAELGDGSVAGEKEALAFFRAREPGLDRALRALEPGHRRAEFGNYFASFQNPGSCRQRQKWEVVRQLKLEFRLRRLMSEHRTALDPSRRKQLEADIAQAKSEKKDTRAGMAGDCSGEELDAGTVLPDGTVVGEKEALAYFRTDEPALHEALAPLPSKERRALYGKYFMWFQRSGRNCRTRQKAEMIRQLKSELRIRELASQRRAAKDPARIAERQAALEAALAERVDSDLRMLEMELGNLKGHLREFEGEIAAAEKELTERRAARDGLISGRLRELLTTP